MAATRFRVLYSDIGGVLGSNGWDSGVRRSVCKKFNVPLEEIESRHNLMFDSYERGFMKFEDYLGYVFFDKPRDFTIESVRDFTYDLSAPWPDNIDFFASVKRANGLKFGLISNEGEGITGHRMNRFGLREVADFIVVSHCVHMRKPDKQIWQLALDLAQATSEQSIYVDDREIFVKVAGQLGFTALQHTDLASTRQKFRQMGLIAD